MIRLFAAALACAAASGSALDINKWRQRSAATSSGVVRLTTDNYTSAVLDSPRDYNTIVLFTASEQKFGCVACITLANEFIVAARSYAAAHGVSLLPKPGDNTSDPSAYHPETDDRTTFFGVVDFRYNQEAFGMHGFKSVPYIAVFKANKTRKLEIHDKMQRVVIPAENLHGPTEGTLDAAAILALVPDETIAVIRPASERTSWAVVATCIVAIFGALISCDTGNIFFYRRTWFWVAAAFVLYGVSISGAIGCVIKNPPWYGMGKDGKATFFSGSGGHDQYVLEGLVIGALNVGAAGSAIALVLLARSRTASVFVKVVVGALCFALWIALYLRILGFYQLKTPWYKVESLLSEHSQRSLRIAYVRAGAWWAQTALPALRNPLATLSGWHAAVFPAQPPAAAPSLITNEDGSVSFFDAATGKTLAGKKARAAAAAASAAALKAWEHTFMAQVIAGVGLLVVFVIALPAVMQRVRWVLRGCRSRASVGAVGGSKEKTE